MSSTRFPYPRAPRLALSTPSAEHAGGARIHWTRSVPSYALAASGDAVYINPAWFDALPPEYGVLVLRRIKDEVFFFANRGHHLFPDRVATEALLVEPAPCDMRGFPAPAQE